MSIILYSTSETSEHNTFSNEKNKKVKHKTL